MSPATPEQCRIRTPSAFEKVGEISRVADGTTARTLDVNCCHSWNTRHCPDSGMTEIGGAEMIEYAIKSLQDTISHAAVSG